MKQAVPNLDSGISSSSDGQALVSSRLSLEMSCGFSKRTEKRVIKVYSDFVE